jgi:Tfp pilus assembly protein PilV
MRNKFYSQGFSLVELLVYLASMLLVVAAISYAMINVYGVYVSMTSAARADRAAGTLMQILATELRIGAAIDQAESVFNSPQGQLTITAYDGVTETEKVFRLETDRVILETDGVETSMTPEDMQASKLLFTQIVTPLSYAVRYEIDITYSVQGELITKTYPGLVVMRRSYD